MLSPLDMQLFAAIKILFWVFFALGIVWYKKQWPLWIYAILFGTTQAVSYVLLVTGTVLPFWGLVGDEVFIAALYNAAATHSFADFAYAELPPFYPPLFFWMFGVFGHFFSLNGVQLGKLAAATTFLLLPLFLYLAQSFFWKNKKESPAPATFLIGPILLFALLPTATIILKAYEVVSASLFVLWLTFVMFEAQQRTLNLKKIFFYGISGGILFMTFYFWFILGGIGLVLYQASLGSKQFDVYTYKNTLFVGLIALVISLPYVGPLIHAYMQYGTENWQLGFTVVERLATVGPGIPFNLIGLVTLFGFGTLLYYRKETYPRILLSLFTASYVWYILGLVLIVFFQTPIQEDKGFLYFNTAILSFAAAYGVHKLWKFVQEKQPRLSSPLVVIALWLVATQLIFGSFVDDPNVQDIRTRSTDFQKGEQALVGFLNQDKTLAHTVTLSSGMGVVHAFTPIRTFHYINAHASHPAARFSERIRVIQELSQQENAAALHTAIQQTPFGTIDRFVFFQTNTAAYDVFYHADGYPNGIEEKSIQFSKELFDEEYFDRTFESLEFIVIEPKKL